MKKQSFLLIIAFSMMAIIAKADIFDDIVLALKNGDAKELAKYFDTSIELKTLDKSNVYSRKQAELVLKDFFEKYKVKGFTMMHKGSSSKGALYAIGNLETAQGTYRTNLYIKDIGGKPTIQELTIEQK
ncbi:MAG: DUF4783 domain-containing protein [Bacteroidetes bacterium]|nr:DUF4783 domain-containing protein [Bacteroidota bacterium]